MSAHTIGSPGLGCKGSTRTDRAGGGRDGTGCYGRPVWRQMAYEQQGTKSTPGAGAPSPGAVSDDVLQLGVALQETLDPPALERHGDLFVGLHKTAGDHRPLAEHLMAHRLAGHKIGLG